MSSERRIWRDGELVPWSEATVHVLSHGLQRGALVFDYVSVHETARGIALFRLQPHLERFERSCQILGLPLALDIAELTAATFTTVRANPGCHAVKISAFLPSIEVELVPQDDHVSVAIAAYDVREDVIAQHSQPFHWQPELRLWIEKERRNRRDDILPPQAKVSANYGPLLLAKWQARRRGYDDILLLTESGHLAESPTTNLFLVDPEGCLCTPPAEQVLLGVTRASLLELAAAERIEIREEDLLPADLFAASEAFLSATTVGVWPIVAVDDRAIGASPPGPVGRVLAERLEKITAGQDPAFEHWLEYV